MSIAFDRPFVLVLVLLFVPCIFILHKFFKSLFTLNVPLGPPGGIPFKAPSNSSFFVRLFFFLELIGVLFLLAAAAGPHLSYNEVVWLNRGADIIFVLDVSPSMAALDMNGRSRMETARDLVRDFTLRRPSDSLGLTAVGEEAVLLVPLTTDRESFFSRLDSIMIGELGDSTALGMGLGIAALHIANSTAPRRVVVLITDGENNAGAVHPETAASLLADMGISLWVIGVGSGGMVAIDYVDPVTRSRRTGTFDSRYDTESLISLARKGGGVWIPAASAEAFSLAFEQLDETEMIIRRSGTVIHKETFHSFFIVFGVLLILLVRFFRIYIMGAFI